ncbi:MAG: hypothetical protein P8N02_13265, partial [Actinomycetota bacterium]|nr:hypothetical protein [Actinomycetota bacterium]
MKIRRSLIIGAAVVVAAGGALVAFSPAGAQSGPAPGPAQSAPDSQVVVVDTPDGLGEIPEECIAVLDLDLAEGEMEAGFGHEELTDEDRAEIAEFTASLRAHLDAAG